MMVSRCCREAVWVYCGNEGTSYYVCEKCEMACDTMMSLELPDTLQEFVNAEV